MKSIKELVTLVLNLTNGMVDTENKKNKCRSSMHNSVDPDPVYQWVGAKLL